MTFDAFKHRKSSAVTLNQPVFEMKQEKQKNAVHLIGGLHGLENLTAFELFDHKKNSPLKRLQCLQDPLFSFFVVNPNAFYPDYTIDLDAHPGVSQLALDDTKNIAIAVLVSFSKNHESIFLNLKSPLIFNAKTRTGCQIILSETNHLICQPLFFEAAPLGQNEI